MTGRRLLRVLAVSAAAAVLGSQAALAQVATLSSTNWFADSCPGKSCAQSSVTVGFVPVGGEFLVGQSFTRAGAFSDGCPACKENDRPFFVPPGILMRVADGVAGREFGLGLADRQREGLGNAVASGGAGHASEGDVAQSAGSGSLIPGSSGATAVQAVGPTVIAATSLAATTAVTVNPEPGTILLIATGMFGLVPIIGRRRRR